MRKETKKAIAVFIFVLVGAAVAKYTGISASLTSSQESAKNHKQELFRSTLFADVATPNVPELSEYLQAVKQIREAALPVLVRIDLDDLQKQVLALALSEPRFTSFVREPASKEALRNEIFAVRPSRYNEHASYESSCNVSKCFIIELYNFTYNLTSQALVSSADKKVLHVRHLRNFQPEIPPHLQKIAELIAIHTPEVLQEAKQTLAVSDLVMSGTKTALNESKCERSNHLCVSPTFVKGQQALWTIVDLTEAKVVGTRWTEWTGQPAGIVTEGRLRDQTLLEDLCLKPKNIERDGWKFEYSLTSSDGIAFEKVTYKNKPILASYKNMDWHVSYSNTDGFGYSDAVGCPLFSAAAVVPAEFGKIKEVQLPNGIKGFEYHQDFLSKQWPLPCNYYYEQRLQLYDDASLRLALASVGRGCGDNGTYRPVMRFELAEKPRVIFVWKEGRWQEWLNEAWELQPESLSPEGYWLKIETTQGSGFYLEPGHAQFQDKGRGDNAYLYLTAAHVNKDEGASDLPTMGPCCNTDHQQGPEKFIDNPPELLTGKQVVFWYVPQLKNEGTPGREYCWGSSHIENGVVVKEEYPCIAGPRLIPF